MPEEVGSQSKAFEKILLECQSLSLLLLRYSYRSFYKISLLRMSMVLKMTPVRANFWAVLACGVIMASCLAQEDFGEDMDQMEDPVDLESLTEGSKRSSQHQSNAKALGEEASYGEQTVLALQQLGLVLGPADN